MPSAAFEPAIPATEWQQNLALDRAATGIGTLTLLAFHIHSHPTNGCCIN